MYFKKQSINAATCFTQCSADTVHVIAVRAMGDMFVWSSKCISQKVTVKQYFFAFKKILNNPVNQIHLYCSLVSSFSLSQENQKGIKFLKYIAITFIIINYSFIWAYSHLVRNGGAVMYCWGSRSPGEVEEGPPGNPEAAGLSMGKHVCWLLRMSPCSRLGIGWRAVSAVFGRGRGGLLWLRLMTGMCWRRVEDDEDKGRAAEVVGVGRRQGDVLVGAGRRGGGEERVGDVFADAAAPVVLFDQISSSSSISMLAGSGVSVLWLVNTVVRVVGDWAEGVVRTSVHLFFWAGGLLTASFGLCCSVNGEEAEDEDGEEEEGWGEAEGCVEFSFSIMVVTCLCVKLVLFPAFAFKFLRFLLYKLICLFSPVSLKERF